MSNKLAFVSRSCLCGCLEACICRKGLWWG